MSAANTSRVDGEVPAVPFDIDAFLASLTREPGVYRMYDAQDRLLYVGKARHLKNRVGSYFRSRGLSLKTQALVGKISRIDVTVALSETEALILEQTLIKEHRPPYNILLRDDKSYPYIHLSAHEFPRLSYQRGSRREKGQFFGPYPGSQAVRETLNWLEKTFRLRPCDDAFFRNRTRPCLKYQVQRCTGPCVGAVSADDYADQVRLATLFLKGRSDDIARELGSRMEQAASALDFEQAARWRDQIAAIRHVQEQQYAEREGGDVDVFGVAIDRGLACIQVVFVRGGRVLGGKGHFQNLAAVEADGNEVTALLEEFLPQFYLGAGERDLPSDILLPETIDFASALSEAISQVRGRAVSVSCAARGTRAGWQRLATKNAGENLASHLANRQHQRQRHDDLFRQLGMDTGNGRLECFDISHTMGESPVASCVAFDSNGPMKSGYKRFNIRDVTPGDDYAAIRQAVHRRYEKLSGLEDLPALVLIDGGTGQLEAARHAFLALGLPTNRLVSIAKGPSRKAGLEVLHTSNCLEGFTLARDSGGTLMLQQIRDEAHRFAITGHRGQRNKARQRSGVEDVPGVGPARRKALLAHFGGMTALRNASVEEIAKVRGINKVLAESIYAALHSV